MPLSVDTPAPPKNTILSEAFIEDVFIFWL